jgi:hypothetical protein
LFVCVCFPFRDIISRAQLKHALTEKDNLHACVMRSPNHQHVIVSNKFLSFNYCPKREKKNGQKSASSCFCLF